MHGNTNLVTVSAPADLTAAGGVDDGHRGALSGIRARYDRLVEHAPDGIIVHVGGRIVLANAAAIRMAVAEGASQLLGRPITDLLTPPYLKAAEAQLIRDGDVVRDEPVVDKLRCLDGGAIDVEVTAIPFIEDGQPAAHLVIRDVTDRLKGEASLALAASQLRLLLAQLPALIWTTDSVMRVTTVLGLQQSALVDCLSREAAIVSAQAAALGGESVDTVTEYGDQYLSVHLEPLRDTKDVIVGTLGMLIDVSARKREEIRRADVQKSEAVGQLAGGVAHEVNNMMAAAIGFTELLLENPDVPPDQRADLLEIQRAAQRAATVTSQLLAFSRRGFFQPEVKSPDALIESIAAVVRRLLGETLHLDLRLGCAGLVRLDVGQFEQVIVNLAINARDAMKAGGTLSLSTSMATVTQEVDHRQRPIPPGDYAIVEIQDTGVGMAPAVLARIFEPFFTTKPIGKGTGLGLAAVEGIVDRNGGFIRVSSMVGEGTTFRLCLPVVREAEAPARATVAPGQVAIQPEGYTVLVVDDDAGVRKVVARCLTLHGFHVVEASSGAAALTGTTRPDAALLDVTMPDMDGGELARRLRTAWPDLPVVFMSGHADQDVERHIGSLPEATLLRKPFDMAAVVSAMQASVTGRPLRQAT